MRLFVKKRREFYIVRARTREITEHNSFTQQFGKVAKSFFEVLLIFLWLCLLLKRTYYGTQEIGTGEIKPAFVATGAKLE
jgi:hypothetical protein